MMQTQQPQSTSLKGDTVTIKVPRALYDRVIRPMLDLMNPTPGQDQFAAQVLALLDEDVSALLARLIDLKPANQRAPWASTLVRLILDRMKAKGRASDLLREEIRGQIAELDEQSLSRILGKRLGHTTKKGKAAPPTPPALQRMEPQTGTLPVLVVAQ